MELHTRPDGVVDPTTFERETLARIGMPREIAMRHRLPQFNHLFASDCVFGRLLQLSLVRRDGRRHVEGVPRGRRTLGQDHRRNGSAKYILAPGNSTDRAEAYRQFRGRDPDVKALLEKRGFPNTLRVALHGEP